MIGSSRIGANRIGSGGGSGTAVTVNAIVSQDAVEVLVAVSHANARISQDAVEVLEAGASAARVSQEAVEVLEAGTSRARASQQAAEVLRQAQITVSGGVSQVSVEVLGAVSHADHIVSQVAVEVLRKSYRTGTGRGNGGELFCLMLAPNGVTVTATLAAALPAGGTTLRLTGDSGLPDADGFCLTIDDEVMYVVPMGGGAYRILERPLSGTTRALHTAGTTVSWGDTYLMAIRSEVDITADFFNEDDSVTYPGWMIAFDSSQAFLGGDRYAAHVAELVGMYAPGDVGGTNKFDASQPNAICVPEGVTENCPAAMSVPARIQTDIDTGDIGLVRYTNSEASVLELCARSCALQTWYGFKRVDDADADVTLDPPGPPFAPSGGSYIVDVLPLDATESIHGAQESFHDESFVTTTLDGDDRYFTFGPPHFSEKGWPIAALAVRQGIRRIPHWTSPDWHDFLYVYAGWAEDATYVQVLVNRNGLVFGPDPEVDLPGPQDIDGPNATWDDSSYHSSTAWNVVLFEGAYVFIGPLANPGGGTGVPSDVSGSPVGVVGPGGSAGGNPSPTIEGGSGGGIEPPFPESPPDRLGIRFQTESVALPFTPPNILTDHS